jgi:spermidine/putrescine transport system substrate-binding protein
MTNDEQETRILASQASAQRLSRRSFLLGSTLSVVAGGFLLSGCGSSSTPTTSSSATGSGAASPGPIEGSLHMYNWAQYDDPNLPKAFTKQFGPTVQIDTYSSNEEMVAKLAAAQGTSGYDLVIPTGSFIPQMLKNNLLEKLDKSLLPNLANVDPAFLGRSWDPNNDYSVCKDWGSTGFFYDKTIIKRPMVSWQDFIDAAKSEASGKTAVLASPAEVPAIYFWANGIPWTTESTADLDAAENFCVNELAPHIKAFDSYPAIPVTQGTYALAECWNGDARQGLLASKTPDRYGWVLPSPKSELWMDNWAIVAGAKDPVAAHAWINFILDPKNSLTDMEYHGYNTGIKDIKAAAQAAGLKYLDVIFQTPAQLATLETGEINSAEQRLIEIYGKTKAKAA